MEPALTKLASTNAAAYPGLRVVTAKRRLLFAVQDLTSKILAKMVENAGITSPTLPANVCWDLLVRTAAPMLMTAPITCVRMVARVEMVSTNTRVNVHQSLPGNFVK